MALAHLQLLHLAHVQPQLRLYARQHLLWLEGLADVVLAASLSAPKEGIRQGSMIWLRTLCLLTGIGSRRLGQQGIRQKLVRCAQSGF